MTQEMAQRIQALLLEVKHVLTEHESLADGFDCVDVMQLESKYQAVQELIKRQGGLRERCPYDTNGDGNCGKPMCPYCGEGR